MSGVVKDIDGNPIADVQVESNQYTVQTDDHGLFTLEHVRNTEGRYVMNFSKKGYFSVVRSGDAGSVGLVEVVLVKENIPEVSTKSSFSAPRGAKVSVGGMTVDFPKNALVYEDGTPYKGNVEVNVLYLDPKKQTFQSAMPGGDLVAQRSDAQEVPLVSYGMVNVVMKDTKGKKLQVNEEVKSKVTFPIPEGMAEKAPDQMPLWHFDEVKGIWMESGVAVKNGDVYEGEVAHFSWVNLDDPREFVVLKGTVKDDKGAPLSGIKVIVEQVYAYSNEDGEYSVRIPSETDVTVKVRKEDYLNYDNEFSVLVKGQPGNTSYTQDIVLPSFPSIAGKLTNTCDKNVIFPIYCRYEKEGKSETTPFVLPDAKGSFSVRVPSDASNVVVYVRVPGSEEVVQEVAFAGEDYKIQDPIIVCRQSLEEREKPRITMGEEVVPLEGNEFDYSSFEKQKLTLEGSGVNVVIDKYNEESIEQNGHVSIEKYKFESTSARIEKRKVDNYVSIHIIASGKATATEGGEEKDAVFEGTYTISYMYLGKCDDFTRLCWEPTIPRPRIPAPYVYQNNLLELPNTFLFYDKFAESDIDCVTKVAGNAEPFSLYFGYIKADESTFDKAVSLLEESGYLRNPDKDDNRWEKFAAFEKDGVYVRLYYGKNLVEKSTNKKVKMAVNVNTGWSKWIKKIIKKYLGIDLF